MAFGKALPEHIREVTVINPDGTYKVANRDKFEPVLSHDQYVEKCKSESWRFVISGYTNAIRKHKWMRQFEGSELEKMSEAMTTQMLDMMERGYTLDAVKVNEHLTSLCFEKPKSIVENRSLIAKINVDGEEFKAKWRRLQSMKGDL